MGEGRRRGVWCTTPPPEVAEHSRARNDVRDRHEEITQGCGPRVTDVEMANQSYKNRKPCANGASAEQDD